MSGDYLSVADDTGTVHVMVIPDHLGGQTNDDLVLFKRHILPDKSLKSLLKFNHKVSVMEFIEDEILRKREREKLQRERKERLETASQVKVKTDR